MFEYAIEHGLVKDTDDFYQNKHLFRIKITDLGLDGKRVYITASTNGIGKETAVTFLREGATVIINGREENRLMTALNELHKVYGEGQNGGCREI